MSTAQVSEGDRRIVVRGLGTMLAIVALGRGVPAIVRAGQDRADAAETVARELATVRAAMLGGQVIGDTLRGRTARLDSLRRVLLHGTTPQLAAVELATIVTAHASRAGARVNAVSLRADTSFVRELAKVTVRMSVATDIQGLTSMLDAVERDLHLLAVRELTVTGADPGGAETRAETLSAELLVETLALAVAPARGRAR